MLLLALRAQALHSCKERSASECAAVPNHAAAAHWPHSASVPPWGQTTTCSDTLVTIPALTHPQGPCPAGRKAEQCCHPLCRAEPAALVRPRQWGKRSTEQRSPIAAIALFETQPTSSPEGSPLNCHTEQEGRAAQNCITTCPQRTAMLQRLAAPLVRHSVGSFTYWCTIRSHRLVLSLHRTAWFNLISNVLKSKIIFVGSLFKRWLELSVWNTAVR